MNDNLGYAVFALLIGIALFGYLRAADTVEERWGTRRGPLVVGALPTLAVAALIVVIAKSLIGPFVLGVVVATVLYTTYRLRRVS